MKQKAKSKRNIAGWMLMEVMTGLAVLSIVLAGVIYSLNTFARFNNYYFAKQRCIAAAQAQLDSIAATGGALSETEVERLWPDVRLTVRRDSGREDWAGLELLTVTAAAQASGKNINVILTRYIMSVKEN